MEAESRNSEIFRVETLSYKHLAPPLRELFKTQNFRSPFNYFQNRSSKYRGAWLKDLAINRRKVLKPPLTVFKVKRSKFEKRPFAKYEFQTERLY